MKVKVKKSQICGVKNPSVGIKTANMYLLKLSCEFLDTHALFGGTKMQLDQGRYPRIKIV